MGLSLSPGCLQTLELSLFLLTYFLHLTKDLANTHSGQNLEALTHHTPTLPEVPACVHCPGHKLLSLACSPQTCPQTLPIFLLWAFPLFSIIIFPHATLQSSSRFNVCASSAPEASLPVSQGPQDGCSLAPGEGVCRALWEKSF